MGGGGKVATTTAEEGRKEGRKEWARVEEERRGEGQAVRILPRSSAGGSEGRRPVRLSDPQFNRTESGPEPVPSHVEF